VQPKARVQARPTGTRAFAGWRGGLSRPLPSALRWPEFVVDPDRERFMLTLNPDGYLRPRAPR
jgi:hypothetical protein